MVRGQEQFQRAAGVGGDSEPPSGESEPSIGSHIILRGSLAICIHASEIHLRFWNPLLGGEREPLQGFSAAPLDPKAERIDFTKAGLGLSKTLDSGLEIPLGRLLSILLHTLAVLIAETQLALALRVILLRGFASPLHRFLVILRHT